MQGNSELRALTVEEIDAVSGGVWLLYWLLVQPAH